MDNTLSVYQHPTLTVLIDDNRSFLESLAFQMNPQLVHKTFHDPRQAVDWLQHAYWHSAHVGSEPIRVGYDEETYSFERRHASIDIAGIYNLATDRRRFALPSVLVTDYAMPQMNGVEFCKATRTLPCKKILLTGHADEKVAVEAFNSGLIDCYINKKDSDAPQKLEAEITRLQRSFFNQQTGTLKDLLSRHSYAFLSDPAIEELARQLCDRYRFVEYYLFPNPAGLLFFDMQGKATLMVIETRSTLNSHYEVAEDQGAPPDLLSGLREFRLVPFFCDTEGMYSGEIGDNWLSYCLPPQVHHGYQDYFWALFDLPAWYLQGPVYSYAEFLKEQAVN